MPYILNLLYLFAYLLLSPWLVFKAITTGKYRRGLGAKFLGLVPWRKKNSPCVWFHGVSVGEIHLLRQVIAAFHKSYPDFEIVISTTTNTGLEEAKKHFSNWITFYWPLDFTWAIKRAFRQIRPDLVVLAESELWPNFLQIAWNKKIPVAVINGRMSPKSLRRFQKVRFLTRWLFRKVSLLAMQTEPYAKGVVNLGAYPKSVQITGSVKFDGVEIDRANAKTQEMRTLLGIGPDDLVWVAGSTQAPEEKIVLDIFHRMKNETPHLKLILVPRQKERFAEVAKLLEKMALPHVRRSQLTRPLNQPENVVLLDTIGELGAVWGLADLAFVGGSLDGHRGGQNIIEPAAYGAAVLFGPHVWNFREAAQQLLNHDGAIQVNNPEELDQKLKLLCREPQLREEMGKNAKKFVLSQQGATEVTVGLLRKILEAKASKKKAA